MTLASQLAIGLLCSGAIAWVAYLRGSLSASGVVGAMVVGTAIFGFGGWTWGLLLITFFVLSSLLSSYRKEAKEVLSEQFSRGSRRDLGQALANGGVGALVAVASHWFPEPVLAAAFAGAMATVNADTWATELGVLSTSQPRLVTTWKTAAPGTSGAVSVLGTAATTAGAAVMGVAFFGLMWVDGLVGGHGLSAAGPAAWWVVPAASLGGVAGSLFDSLLGATVQAMYHSPTRDEETERKLDPDGSPNTLIRGWRWLDNDLVNFISSVVGALASVAAWYVLR